MSRRQKDPLRPLQEEERAVLEQMNRAGMNVARLNFSHGEFSAHRQNIENIRAAAKAPVEASDGPRVEHAQLSSAAGRGRHCARRRLTRCVIGWP